jgi:3-methyladenine DNA glycosylase/8-oxoguanine DNA glycosylase
MIRVPNNRFTNFIARVVWRHVVSVVDTTELQAEIKNWIDENVGKYDVCVNYHVIIHTDEDDLITTLISKNKIEYRFRTVSSAILFKLTFCDSLVH